ncbi:hypothetical protein EN41_19900 [Agrobacterium tumefaciens]|nr:hypothetical protein EN41_19900 [Agrobacterium tumefaciens]
MARNVSMTDFPWGDLEPHDFGRGLLQLLRLALADGDEAGDAFARALEGLEIMGMQGISLTPDVIEDATRLIEELQGGVSASPPDLNSEWVSWCLSAACTILQGGGTRRRANEEEILFIRAGRYLFEGFCIGRRIRERRIVGGNPAVAPKELH